MNSVPTLDILMATYAGEDYVGEQIESILRQTFQGWQLIVRDDGSTDRTPEILERYRDEFPDKIRKLAPGPVRLGTCGNFAGLLAESRADYIMLADQDDVWLPEKVEESLLRIRSLEKTHGPETPILVHSDLRVVGENLREIADSFWRYHHLNPKTDRFLNRLIVQNVVTGCTVIINRALKHRALPLPTDAIMHDWWLALVASAFGAVDHIRHPTMLYRQHRKNQIGARSWLRYVVKNMVATLRGDDLTSSVERMKKQARAFFERYQDHLPHDVRIRLEDFIHLEQKGFMARRAVLLRHGFLKNGVIRNLGLLIRV
jgi:glycosyltransferase involved in cell wall biosynthesis